MKMLRKVSLFLCIVLPCLGNAQVVINEIMQSNIDCIMDDINEYPDSWVELSNAGASPVSLKNLSVGVTPNAEEAWPLPDIKLWPGFQQLVYCDKEATDLHTNFRLESGNGCSVYLFENGTLIDKLENLPKQPAPNISYGRENEASDTWGYQYKPTPGAKNCQRLCTELLGDPIFVVQGRVFEKNGTYTVKLLMPEGTPEKAEIRYTQDGSEPTETSTLYQEPFPAGNSRVIRARIFCEGYLSPPSVTQSYIVHPRKVNMPVVSIATQSSNFYDLKKGIYVNGNYSSKKKNYEYNWRRPVNIEVFDQPGQESVINQLGEVRCAGAASRGAQLKSLALFTSKRFGKKHFKYEFFPDDRPGQTDYKSIMIRNAGNDFDYLYMRDAMIQRSIARHLDIDYQAWRPALFYLNGKYMGILNIRERGNENNVYTNYDHLEDIDMFENWGSLKQGTWDNLNAFKEFYTEHGHTLEEYSQWLDIDEYINYMAMNIYYNNVDFPANNLMMWRPRTDDGRWRFIAKDVDYALGIYEGRYDYKYLSWIYNNSFDSSLSWGNTYDATRLFRRIMENDDFKCLFLDRMAIFMGSFLNYKHIWSEVWEPMYEAIKAEYSYHREPINKWWPNYADELRKAQTWMQNRTSFFYKHMADYYGMGQMAQMVINNRLSNDERASIRFTFNDIPLCGGSFEGQFFPGHKINLKGESIDGKAVVGWSVLRITPSGSTVNDEVKGDTYSVEMPPCTRLQVNAILGEAEEDGIEDIRQDFFTNEPVDIYDIRGLRHSSLQRGINIVRLKNGEVRKIK